MLVKPANWTPFAPSGFAGIVTGGAIVFFTYIGFDSVSTAAEECRTPQRDLPFGIIASLVVCTLLYVGVAVVLLGMLKYTTFVSGEAAEAPVAYALKVLGAHPFYRTVIVVGALMGMISSLLVFQYGQARIWYAMSRDGLLPKLFSAVHPRFKTPHWSTWIACFAVGIPAGMEVTLEAKSPTRCCTSGASRRREQGIDGFSGDSFSLRWAEAASAIRDYSRIGILRSLGARERVSSVAVKHRQQIILSTTPQSRRGVIGYTDIPLSIA